MSMETTTIRISKKLKAELDKLVQSKQDTYEDIIKRLIDRRKHKS
jgi:Arc/MetJ-type ribon-helix-helix transcriptional regulator